MSQVIDELADDADVALQRKNRDESEMDITPMIDIVFLLLIFFVVCSKMDPVKMGAIPDADNGTPISANDSAVIYIEPAGPDKVILSKADGTALSSDEETKAAQLVEYIDQKLKTTIGKPKNQMKKALLSTKKPGLPIRN